MVRRLVVTQLAGLWRHCSLPSARKWSCLSLSSEVSNPDDRRASLWSRCPEIQSLTESHSDKSWPACVDQGPAATIASDRAWQAPGAALEKKEEKIEEDSIFAAWNPRRGISWSEWRRRMKELKGISPPHPPTLTGIPFPIIVAWAIGKLYYDNEKWVRLMLSQTRSPPFLFVLFIYNKSSRAKR